MFFIFIVKDIVEKKRRKLTVTSEGGKNENSLPYGICAPGHSRLQSGRYCRVRISL